MASIVYQEGVPVAVRAYAGRDKITGQVRNLYRPLPPGTTEEEAQAAKAAIQQDAELYKQKGVAFTVQGVIEYYLDLISADHSPTTIEAYESNARCYLYPFMGKRMVSDLSAHDMISLYTRLLTDGGKDKNPVSIATVNKLHSWLKPAFTYLQGLGVIDNNPMIGLKRMHEEKGEMQPISEYDLDRLVDYLREVCQCVVAGYDYDPRDVAIALDLFTGVRRGELAGFQAKDYRPPRQLSNRGSAEAEICVYRAYIQTRKGLSYKSLKQGAKARRKIVLTGFIVLGLALHIERQEERLRAAGVRVSGATPLFARDDGTPYPPRAYADRLNELKEKLGIEEHVHLHTLRHTHATYLLESGVNIRTVAERLGHSSPTTTLRIYSHVLPGRDSGAAEVFSTFIGGGAEDG